ncbi:MAG TPA: hypothetical protein VN969_05260 [Streptosporangiaceae bacterium]|jgi:hypothetical protein|nr:hypothetical protein [Streptosporangiaceae bacterium]
MADVLHRTYLPFTADQLREHFAPVLGPGERDRHLRYYLASVEEARRYDELIRVGDKPTRAQTRLGRQMEKDERFWLATALMSLYHAGGGSGRGELFARLLERAGLQPPPGFPRWEDALAGDLDLFFEVSLPSPGRYRAWLRDHLGERVPIPYLRKQAEAPGARLEGATKADAMLLAPATGVAVIFEAKVLSDISTHVTFDLARNQLARSIDVMLEANPALPAPLSLRQPERTFLVLLTPALTQPGQAGDMISKSRLYGWLMPAYKDPDSCLLRQHLPHRDGSELAGAAERLGWASWEDCQSVAPGACSWLTPTPGTG